MELKEQVCTFKLANRLQELGVKQDSLFYWFEVIDNFDVPPQIIRGKRASRHGTYGGKDGDWEERVYSAFTVSELGYMLPDFFQEKKWGPMSWSIWYDEDARQANGFPFKEHIQPPHFDGDTEADYRARVLIYLVEKKLVKPE